MPKSSGLGEYLAVGGHDLSGDVGAIQRISTPRGTYGKTGIDKLAHERILGRKDGNLAWASYWNPTGAHPVLSALPTGRVGVLWMASSTLGAPSIAMVGRQIDYGGTRSDDGDLNLAVEVQADQYGADWCRMLTAGEYAVSNALTGQLTDFEGGIGTWVTNQNSTVTAGAVARGGAAGLQVESAAAGNTSAKHVTAPANGLSVTAGTTYFIQGWLRSAVSARTSWVGVNWYNSSNTLISTSQGSNIVTSTSAWTLSSGNLLAPVGAVKAIVLAQFNAAGAGSEVHYVDDVSLFPIGAAYDFGTDQADNWDAQGHLQVLAFAGTDVTVKIQTSTDSGATDAFADRIAFTSATAVGAERKTMTSPATEVIERYARVGLATTAGFTALTLAVALSRNDEEVVF